MKIMTTEIQRKRKVKDSWLERKRNGVIKCRRFFNMKNLRDKFAKLPDNKVEDILLEEINIETEVDKEMEIEEERDGSRQ